MPTAFKKISFRLPEFFLSFLPFEPNKSALAECWIRSYSDMRMNCLKTLFHDFSLLELRAVVSAFHFYESKVFSYSSALHFITTNTVAREEMDHISGDLPTLMDKLQSLDLAHSLVLLEFAFTYWDQRLVYETPLSSYLLYS